LTSAGVTQVVVCADVGSTFTKVAAVDADSGALLATASEPTTVATDVLDGLGKALDSLAAQGLPVRGLHHSDLLVCSSAGGGLRLAVVGYERAITAEAGHRVGLSAGAKVVHVAAGALDPAGRRALAAAQPDVVLLVGGTDGGNADILLHNAHQIARVRPRRPVVVAGNADVRDEVVDVLTDAAVPVTAAANVLPKIGVLEPTSARAAIREMFITHVIGGKRLSRRGDTFTRLVRAATPDAVLAGVETLADGAGDTPGAGDVLVVDVGGATTDVYSVVTPDPEEASLHREVVEVMWRGRTVEGDLGVRWNAPGVVAAALAEDLRAQSFATADLADAAEQRAANPALLPTDDAEAEVDLVLARLAATIACRRHARPEVITPAPGQAVRRGGADLREVRLVVGSGGVLRHADPEQAVDVLRSVVRDPGGGWRTPEHPRVVVDRSYVLAAAGLLALDGRAPLAAALLSPLRTG
jgi:uncharacterized protein (TIGR01319 family)